MSRLRNGFIFTLFGILFAWQVGHEAFAQDKPLEIGIHPYLSARALFTQHDPLRQFLAKRLKREVRFYTTATFKQFIDNALRGEYDLLITAAHIARLAQLEKGYEPIIGYTGGVDVLLVVAKDSPLTDVKALRNRKVAIPDRLALVAMTGIGKMKDLGLRPQKDFQLTEMNSFNTAMISVTLNQSDAAITSPPPLAQLPKEIRDQLRVLSNLGEVDPGLVVMINPKLPQPLRETIRKLCLEFAANTVEGKTFLQNSDFQKIVPLDQSGLRHMDRYMHETKGLIGG